MKTIVKKTTGALAVAAALVAGVCTSCSTKSEKTIGIQLYSVMDAVKANPEASLQRLAEMGYNAAELVQWGGDPNVFGLPAADFKALCDRYGIDIISTHSSIQASSPATRPITPWRACSAWPTTSTAWGAWPPNTG